MKSFFYNNAMFAYVAFLTILLGIMGCWASVKRVEVTIATKMLRVDIQGIGDLYLL